MLGLGTLAKKVFGTPNDRKVKATRPLIEKINGNLNFEFTTHSSRKDKWLLKILKNIFYTIYFKKKSHLIWEFKAVKNELNHY